MHFGGLFLVEFTAGKWSQFTVGKFYRLVTAGKG